MTTTQRGHDAGAHTTPAEAVAAAAASVPGVGAMSGGRFGEVATYLPKRRVVGVRLGQDHGEVHIEVDLSRPILTVADEVRAAAEDITGMPITVVVEDISAAAN